MSALLHEMMLSNESTESIINSLVAVGTNSSPFINAYAWKPGFGVKIADPAALPTSQVYDVAFSPNDSHIVIGQLQPPIAAYKLNNKSFGAKSSPSTTIGGPTTYGYKVSFSPSGSHVAVALVSGITTPFAVYPWNPAAANPFGTKIADPAIVPAGAVPSIEWSPNGSYVAMCNNGTPYVHAYNWTGSAFGSKFANPASTPNGFGTRAKFTPNGSHLVVLYNASPYIAIYNWSAAGFGTRLANITTGAPLGTCYDVAFTNGYMAVASSVGPFIHIYPWNGTSLGTAWNIPVGSRPPAAASRVSFDKTGKFLMVGHSNGSLVTVYDFDPTAYGNALGPKVTDPSVALAGTLSRPAFQNT